LASPLIELETFLPYRIAVLANVMGTAIASAYEERYGLTIPEWRVIAVLTRYPGLSAREVAEKSHMDAVAVSRAVNRLLRAGRLRRAIARDDRRRSVLQVSEAGAVVYREVAPMALEFERSLVDALPGPERAMLDRAISMLMQRAENLSSTLRANGQAHADKRKVTRTSSRHRTAR
jgi:DNA-binding MarR family transcriptional regulator